MAGERYTYIDATKGILIMILVFHHFIWLSVDGYQIANDLVTNLKPIRAYLYMPWFMTTFFMITGACTHWEKKESVIEIIKTGALTLVLPCYLIMGYQHWFISAMFIVRILFWYIQKYTPPKYALIVCMGVSFIGCCCLNIDVIKQHETLACFHAMAVIVFMEIGVIIKRHFKNLKFIIISAVLYCTIAFVLCVYDKNIPVLESFYGVSILNFPFHIFLATMGALMVIGIGWLFQNNNFIVFLGKMSIVVFLFQEIVLHQLISRSSRYMEYCNADIYMSILCISGLYTMTIAILYIIAKIMDTKYGRYVIGKF